MSNSISMYKLVDYKRNSGLLFCLVGPTASGKTSLAQELLKNTAGLKKSVSATTRTPRPGEIEGESYFFINKEEFLTRKTQGDFFEAEQVHGNWYATPKSYIEQTLSSGEDMLLAIDIRGAINIKKQLPTSTVVVFILPPSHEELRRRITSRGALPEEEIQRRLSTAKTEVDSLDVPEYREAVDYIIHNKEFNLAFLTLSSIVRSERQRLSRLTLLDG